jgi:hypothetical protein
MDEFQHLRLRIDRLDRAEWVAALESEIERVNLNHAIRIVPTESRLGFQLADATVITALIAAGAQVLTGLITAAVTVYAARKGKEKPSGPSQPIIVVIQGTQDTAQLEVSASHLVSPDEISKTVNNIGTPREISVGSK